MFDFVDNISPSIQILIVLMIITLAIFSTRSPVLVDTLYRYLSLIKGKYKNKFKIIKTYDDLNNLLKPYGYSYNVKQNIFISNLDAWQREMGYCRLYDEAAAPMSMIIDCEPIYFEYDNKRWLIEFWKGQYGMTIGCEIGVYYTEGPDIKTEDFKLTWYECADDNNLLNMSFSLIKDGKTIIKRRDNHWWLTGFILGEFSQPWELKVHLNVTLKNHIMRDAFLRGLQKAGYTNKDVVVVGSTVGIRFDKPKTTQPYTRIKETDELTQIKNKILCDSYQEITKEYDNIIDKIAAVQRLDPVLFERILLLGKSKSIFSEFDNIKAYMEWL